MKLMRLTLVLGRPRKSGGLWQVLLRCRGGAPWAAMPRRTNRRSFGRDVEIVYAVSCDGLLCCPVVLFVCRVLESWMMLDKTNKEVRRIEK